ncbi:MFS transporter [Methylocapsa sp. S129]|uniref:MFS transporter n=1 Tax=Methylocapsa sp. S129 TaxID=1641869 RepID=UPI00131AAC75|nr:MFS transporter [Methylocapsa sp. S129]
MSYRRGWVALLLFTVVVINYIDRVALSVAAKPIASEFGLSPVEMGYLFSSFLWSYVLCLLPIGLVVDRFGSKTIIAAGLTIWSLATVFTGLTWNFGTILLARLVMGVGEATTYPAGARVIRDWIPERERGQITMIFNGGSAAGPALGALLAAWLASTFGWRTGFIVLGLLGFVWLAAWMTWFGAPERVSWLSPRERDKILGERNGQGLAAAQESAPQSSLGYLLTNPTIWALILSQATIVYGGYSFLTWLPTYLQQRLTLSVMGTGLFTSIPYTATLLVGLAIARMSDRLPSSNSIRSGARRYFTAGTMLFGLLALAAPMIDNAVLLTVLFTLVVASSNVSSALNMAILNDLSDNPRDASRLMSLVILGGNCGGLIGPIVTGYVVQSTGEFIWAFRIASALLVIGAILLLTMCRGRIAAQHAPLRTLASSEIPVEAASFR